MSRDYDDGERPSWRDIDKRREGSSHTKQDKKAKKDAPEDRWNMGRYKKALDSLFMGDKGTLEHQKLHSKVHKSYGTPSFLTSVQGYIERYGAPDDMSTLLLILDSKDDDIILLAMEKLKAIYPEASPREQEDIRRKLSIMALTHRSPDIKERASEVVGEIKSNL